MSCFISEIPFEQLIKGNITGINPLLLYFEVDQKFRIYVDITKHLLEFPCKGEVEIINPKKFNGRTAIIGPETIWNAHKVFTVDNIKTIELLSILKANNVDEDELIAMDNILRQLEPFFPENMLPKCLITLIRNAPVTQDLQEPLLGYKRSFRKCQIKLPRDLNYVNDKSTLYTFMAFDGMCSYNIYPNQSVRNVTDCCAEYLFGILDVDQMSGYFSLSNKTAKFLVKFYATVKDLYVFKSTLVMIKNWTVFTEVFEEKSATSLRYILVNVKDVTVVESIINNSGKTLLYRKDEFWDTGHRKTAFIQITKKSEIIFGYSKVPECWIEALVLEGNDSFCSQQLVYLILSNDHIAIVPFLKEHAVYQILYYEDPIYLNIESYRELRCLKSSRKLCKIGEDTIFQESDKSPFPQNDLFLEGFQDVATFLKAAANQEKMFSFCLKIFKKELRDNSNFPSWYAKRHKNSHIFGTPGKNIQMRLIFSDPTINHSYIDLYFTNRDNHVVPLGLIDNMTVKIKHVQVYNNKYMKTSVFTSFEILEFCPRIMFSSVNFDISTWLWRNKTPKTLLGTFSCLPQNCVVHGTFLLQAITRLTIAPVCESCKKPSVAEMMCRKCNSSERDLNIDMSICVQDFINPTFYMSTENKHFLFDLIGLRSHIEIKHFCNAFLNIDVLHVDFCKLEEFRSCTKDADSQIFLETLINIIKTQINFNLFPMVDAVCILQKKKDLVKLLKIIEFVFL